MTLHVYGDESADERCERVFAVSGILGNDAEWDATEYAWLQVTRGEVFHAAEWEHAGRFDEYRALVHTLVHGHVAGFCVSLDLIAFNELFPNRPADGAYYKCLHDLINVMATCGRNLNASGVEEPVALDFTFDHRKQSNANAGLLYKFFHTQPEWVDDCLFNRKATLSFGSRENPRIQMADLIAREGMKDMDRRIGPKRGDARASKLALETDRRFTFVERDRDYIIRMKATLPELEKKFGYEGGAYRAWLVSTGRVQHGQVHDNWGNRIAYMAQLNRKAV